MKKDSERPLVIAHRGASAHAPENTAAAFRMAVEAGADGVEFDVRLAADGVPVAIHDATLERTTGTVPAVAGTTSDMLAKLDAGSWFNARFPLLARPEFALEGVPTLDAVLDIVKDLSGPIFIELKCERDEEVAPLVAAVAPEIAASPLAGRIIVKSFKLGVIPQLRCALPGVKTAALFAPQIMHFLRKEKYIVDMAHEFGADHISIHRSLVSRKLARKAERRGMPVTVWTIDDARGWRRAEKLGVYAVITNDPGRMVKRH
jgi:glycerophosphoryl diester phosphodiesterase